MMCPGDVGRDSGEWGGQESEVLQDWKSHQELGEEALAEGAVLLVLKLGRRASERVA